MFSSDGIENGMLAAITEQFNPRCYGNLSTWFVNKELAIEVNISTIHSQTSFARFTEHPDIDRWPEMGIIMMTADIRDGTFFYFVKIQMDNRYYVNRTWIIIYKISKHYKFDNYSNYKNTHRCLPNKFQTKVTLLKI